MAFNILPLQLQLHSFRRRKLINFNLLLLLSILVLLGPSPSYSWGPRGHSLVCEAAIHVVKNEDLKRFLVSKTQAITYLCNLPDSYWKSLNGTESGNSTHFFEPDVIGLSIEQVPLDFAQLSKQALGQTNLNTSQAIISVARELGSSWWRADQFKRLAIESGKKSLKEPGVSDESNDFYRMWVMMGIMGHFIGDNAQPYHNTRDYDGWFENHGGIHKYYETDLVNELPVDIISNIAKAAENEIKLFQSGNLQSQKPKSLIEKMKTLATFSYKDLKDIIKLDPITKPSKIVKEKGMELKTPAERKSASESVGKYKTLLTTELARGAALLALTWDEIYNSAGKPNLQKGNTNQFPHEYEFIAPDYAQ